MKRSEILKRLESNGYIRFEETCDNVTYKGVVYKEFYSTSLIKKLIHIYGTSDVLPILITEKETNGKRIVLTDSNLNKRLHKLECKDMIENVEESVKKASLVCMLAKDMVEQLNKYPYNQKSDLCELFIDNYGNKEFKFNDSISLDVICEALSKIERR